MASKNCWMAWLVFLVSVLLLMTSELAAAREQLGRTSKPVMNSGQVGRKLAAVRGNKPWNHNYANNPNN
ncbi:hypothetical protein EZV62_005592 [Acer yangbiense]|uniref:Uncharacterized protein n=1 Tax=Acer yangbiense TaxID=1000413 RepID=A0A5C7IMP1_9ROSI|nr:hypothetical protein EZV62_005592 [Acer yangbiense]